MVPARVFDKQGPVMQEISTCPQHTYAVMKVLKDLSDPSKELQLLRMTENANRFAARYLTSSARRTYWVAALRR